MDQIAKSGDGVHLPAVGLPPCLPAPAARLTWRDALSGMTFIAPSVAVVGAGVVIIVHALFTSPHTTGLTAPVCVGMALLLLALLRPAVTFLFSRADQPVEVRVCTENGEARVSVHDNGVGIPLADQSHIWERFYQAERVEVQSGSRVGFGLGLYVSRAIVEGHTGQVGVESVPSQGTTIWFTLPLIASAASSSPEAGAGPPSPASGEHEHDP